MRMPAKMSPPRQITAPAYMAKVLNVPIKVCAPEKSIVPWACATVPRDRARKAGAIERMARIRLSIVRSLTFRYEDRQEGRIRLDSAAVCDGSVRLIGMRWRSIDPPRRLFVRRHVSEGRASAKHRPILLARFAIASVYGKNESRNQVELQ